jgi:hypothetical protein
MPVKKSMRVKKAAASSKKPATPPVAAPAAKTPVRWMRTFGAETIFIALMCIMAAAMLVAAAHGASETPERPRAAAVEADSTLPQPEPAKAADPASSVSDSAEPESVGTTARMTTISGCLERSDETFRLKDTSGAYAPKARSWKSGFLRKSAASIDVVDAMHRLRLANHIGHRVSLTGTLEDRSMQARSLQRIAGTCK